MPRPTENIESNDAEISLASLTCYPVYTHQAHPLNIKWVKIPASLIKKLHVPPNWEASHPGIAQPGAAMANSRSAFPLYHYLNHPLPYIQLCGIVVDVSEPIGLNARVVQLDDSSGELADVVIKKLVDPNAPKQWKSRLEPPQLANELQKGDEIPKHVLDWACVSWLGGRELDTRPIKVGTILRAKGRLCPWKKGRQLLLEKFDIFTSTSQEIDFWDDMTDQFSMVLSKPWELSLKEQDQLRADFEEKKLDTEKKNQKLLKQARKNRKLKKQDLINEQTDELVEEHELSEGAAGQMERKQAPSIEQHSSGNSVRKGLAPSYQVPKEQSSSLSRSSNSSRLRGIDGASDVLPNETNEQGESHQLIGVAIRQKQDSPRAQEDSSIIQEPSTLEVKLVDMGCPSQWEIHLGSTDQPTQILTGVAWLELRSKLMEQRPSTISSDHSPGQATGEPYSIQQEWDQIPS